MASNSRRTLNSLMDSYVDPPRGRNNVNNSRNSATPRGRGSIRHWLGSVPRGNVSEAGSVGRDGSRRPTASSENQQVGSGTQESMDTFQDQSTPAPPAVQENERNKRTVQDRSPLAQEETVRNTRRRLNEFDLGEEFRKVEQEMRKRMEEAEARAPVEVREYLGEAMRSVAEAITGMMNNISDGVRQERLERETLEDRMEDQLSKVVEDVKEQRTILDSLTEIRIKSRVRESTKEMEDKIAEAQCAVKMLDIDIGRETEDKREIVRKTIDAVRAYVREEDVRWLDRIISRTKIVILGRGTVRREGRSGDEFTVPTLFQCRDRRDTEDLEAILREAGWYPTFHWPKEVLEMVNHARDEVRRMGFSERDYFVKVRPEKREGKTMLRAEVKPKAGGRYMLKGLFLCPPLHRVLWDNVPDLLRSQLLDRN